MEIKDLVFLLKNSNREEVLTSLKVKNELEFFKILVQNYEKNKTINNDVLIHGLKVVFEETEKMPYNPIYEEALLYSIIANGYYQMPQDLLNALIAQFGASAFAYYMGIVLQDNFIKWYKNKYKEYKIHESDFINKMARVIDSILDKLPDIINNIDVDNLQDKIENVKKQLEEFGKYAN